MKRVKEMEYVIRSMGNSGAIGGKIKTKAVALDLPRSSFRINGINKTEDAVAPLMIHANR